MKKQLISAISLVLLAGAFLSPAMAAGPRASDASDWPGMSQSAIKVSVHRGLRALSRLVRQRDRA